MSANSAVVAIRGLAARPAREYWQGRLGLAAHEELLALGDDPAAAWRAAGRAFDGRRARDAFFRTLGVPAGSPQKFETALTSAGVPPEHWAWPAVAALLVCEFVKRKDPTAFLHAMQWWAPDLVDPTMRDGQPDRRAAALLLLARSPELLVRVQALSDLYRRLPSYYKFEADSADGALAKLLDELAVQGVLDSWAQADGRRRPFTAEVAFQTPEGDIFVGLRRNRAPRTVRTRDAVEAGALQERATLQISPAGLLRLTAASHKTVATVGRLLLEATYERQVQLLPSGVEAGRDDLATMVRDLLSGHSPGDGWEMEAQACRFEERNVDLAPCAVEYTRPAGATLQAVLEAHGQGALANHPHLVESIAVTFLGRTVDLLFPRQPQGGLVRFGGARLPEDARQELRRCVRSRWQVELATAKTGMPRVRPGRLFDEAAFWDRALVNGAVIADPLDDERRLAKGWARRAVPWIDLKEFSAYQCDDEGWDAPAGRAPCTEWIEVRGSGEWGDEDDRGRDADAGWRCARGHDQSWSSLRFHPTQRRLSIRLRRQAILAAVTRGLESAFGGAVVERQTGVFDVPGGTVHRVVVSLGMDVSTLRAQLSGGSAFPTALIWCGGAEALAAMELPPRVPSLLLGAFLRDPGTAVQSLLDGRGPAEASRVLPAAVQPGLAAAGPRDPVAPPPIQPLRFTFDRSGLVKLGGKSVTGKEVVSGRHAVLRVLLDRLAGAGGEEPLPLTNHEIQSLADVDPATVATLINRARETLAKCARGKLPIECAGSLLVTTEEGHRLDHRWVVLVR